MASKIGLNELSNEDGVTIVPIGGFSNWPMVKNAELLFGTILEEEINTFIILDRDYRCSDEIEKIRETLSNATNYLHFWERKELENYLIMKLRRRTPLQADGVSKAPPHESGTR